MSTKTKKVAILTGAGFTKNFGGFLIENMNSEIYNSSFLHDFTDIKDMLSSEDNFEKVYSEIMFNPKVEEAAKKALRNAVAKTYQFLDEVLQKWWNNSDQPNIFNTYGLFDMFQRLLTGSGGKGIIFTLNQDLLLERLQKFCNTPGVLLNKDFKMHLPHNPFKPNYFVRLPDEDGVKIAKEQYENAGDVAYVKLHGSYGWLSSDGEEHIVMGTNKIDQIGREPLLRWYSEIFKSYIQEGDRKLLIIGYGFGD
ncbi:MAG: hypothetical protein CMI53_00395 [Parcubacteria group bacterium]|nr:hypothetical protein [Parcubacteria group bacterium]|tara:strand:+ start:4498 stop:5253 length:756 start_codon:yes stop_codon:yes gene_type:complete